MANTLTSSGGAAVALTFESTTFEVVDQQGQQWLKSGQIAQALGYADETAITKLYSRRKDEFTNSMSQTVNLTVQGQMRETRIFSLRGAHLLAMFARTAIAKLFRIWVLDLIESSALKPPVSTTITPAQCQHLRELVQLVVESGKQNHGETWNRLHRKMKVNSYLELDSSRFDEACQYLQGKMDGQSMAALVQKHFPAQLSVCTNSQTLPAPSLKNRRWLISFDHTGREVVQSVPTDAFVLTVPELCAGVLEGQITGKDFIDLAYAVNQRQYMTACSNKNRGYGEEVVSKIKDMSWSDLHTINVQASMEVWLRTQTPVSQTV